MDIKISMTIVGMIVGIAATGLVTAIGMSETASASANFGGCGKGGCGPKEFWGDDATSGGNGGFGSGGSFPQTGSDSSGGFGGGSGSGELHCGGGSGGGFGSGGGGSGGDISC